MTDTCPRCLRRGIPPAASRIRGRAVVDAYRCRCGHRWATSRDTTAYPSTTATRPARAA